MAGEATTASREAAIARGIVMVILGGGEFFDGFFWRVNFILVLLVKVDQNAFNPVDVSG